MEKIMKEYISKDYFKNIVSTIKRFPFGYHKRFGGLFIVDRKNLEELNKSLDTIDTIEVIITKEIIDKKGQKRKIVLFQPHYHEFVPQGDFHICSCGLRWRHFARCPIRRCECGVELSNEKVSHDTYVLKEIANGFLAEKEICKTCGFVKRERKRRMGSEEEVEIIKRLGSFYEPFGELRKENVSGGEIYLIWDNLCQTHYSIVNIEELKGTYNEWVIELFKEGEWKEVWYYEVEKGKLKKEYSFTGRVFCADLCKMYFKAEEDLDLNIGFSKKEKVRMFLPKEKGKIGWSKLNYYFNIGITSLPYVDAIIEVREYSLLENYEKIKVYIEQLKAGEKFLERTLPVLAEVRASDELSEEEKDVLLKIWKRELEVCKEHDEIADVYNLVSK